MKPLIGISCSIDAADTGANKEFLNDTYFEAIENAGGVPVILPNTHDPSLQVEMAKRLDGFVISGGPDLDPRIFGSRATGKLGRMYPRRDAAELALLKYVIEETDKPVLGICRGIQSLNVALGGDLILDLPSEGYPEHAFAGKYDRWEEAHDIEVEKGSKLYEILGSEKAGVNSFHHQAVGKPAPGVIVSAKSVPDGVVEAVEVPGERFILGVQWHPECMVYHDAQQNIFRTLVKEAVKTAEKA